VVVRDLYRTRFDPILGEAELDSRTPARIRQEQRHIAEAVAIALFFPVWWGYMPAMMKGYVDSVFPRGFAYDVDADNVAPLLSGKKALVFSSSGADMTYLRRSKQWQAM
jgi:NAD(P)H dehydrogenase (quinone)